jgi:hypothetical protein
VSVRLTNFGKDASGVDGTVQQVAHNLGCTPAALLFFITPNNAAQMDTWQTQTALVIGFCDSALRGGCVGYWQDSGDPSSMSCKTVSSSNTRHLELWDALGGTVYSGQVTAIDATNITIRWNTNDSIARRVAMLAIGDPNRLVLSQYSAPAISLTQNVRTALSFELTPEFIFGAGNLSDVDSNQNVDNFLHCGVAAFEQGMVNSFADAAQAGIGVYANKGKTLASGLYHAYAIDSSDFMLSICGDGVIENFVRMERCTPSGADARCPEGPNPDTTRHHLFMVLSGIQACVFPFTSPLSSGDTTFSHGRGFTPEGAILFSVGARRTQKDRMNPAAWQDNLIISIGVTDGTRHWGSAIQSQHTVPTVANQYVTETGDLVLADNVSATVTTKLITSFGAGKFTVNSSLAPAFSMQCYAALFKARPQSTRTPFSGRL